MLCDASPWGGEALYWHTREDYEDNLEAAYFLQLRWTAEHENLIKGMIGKPDFQAEWEALMLVIALRTWTNCCTRGKVTIIGDAAGVIGDIIAMRARSPRINCFIKEAALHLAPLGLDLFGIHLWSKKNEKADEIIRIALDGSLHRWLTESSTTRSSPTPPLPHLWQHCHPDSEPAVAHE